MIRYYARLNPNKVEESFLNRDEVMRVSDAEVEPFRKLVQAAFGLRRKQMRRVLRSVRGLSAEEADAALERVGVAPDRRPETLAPAEFAALLRTLRPDG